jgi:hypothetical protein
MINIFNVFSLFDSEEQPLKNSQQSTPVDFKDHPYVYLGFFTKMILRGDTVNKQLTTIASNDVKIDTQGLYDLNKLLIYNRAFEYLEKLDLENPEHVDCIVEKGGQEFLVAAERVLEFYASIEQYEKCSVIKKIQDFVKFSQKKLPL